jgi:hypothetical protein
VLSYEVTSGLASRLPFHRFKLATKGEQDHRYASVCGSAAERRESQVRVKIPTWCELPSWQSFGLPYTTIGDLVCLGRACFRYPGRAATGSRKRRVGAYRRRCHSASRGGIWSMAILRSCSQRRQLREMRARESRRTLGIPHCRGPLHGRDSLRRRRRQRKWDRRIGHVSPAVATAEFL